MIAGVFVDCTVQAWSTSGKSYKVFTGLVPVDEPDGSVACSRSPLHGIAVAALPPGRTTFDAVPNRKERKLNRDVKYLLGL